jgi:hypothetical protein
MGAARQRTPVHSVKTSAGRFPTFSRAPHRLATAPKKNLGSFAGKPKTKNKTRKKNAILKTEK